MSLSMKYLIAVSLVAGLFEAASVLFIEQPWFAAIFAVVFLGCAGALWRWQSRAATMLVGVFLLVDVGGVPFYARESLSDWVVQGAFGAVGLLGLAACVRVLRAPRRALA